MLTKVISGGQTGADQAALRAAKAAGIATGGVAPKGWKTETGPAPWLYTTYRLTESTTSNYAERTRANVIAADGTLMFHAATSPGTALTKRTCEIFRRPNRVVFIRPSADGLVLSSGSPTPAAVAEWITKAKIGVLNVAGHRETVCPGIGAGVERYMGKVFAALAAGR